MNNTRDVKKVLIADDDADDRFFFEKAYVNRRDIQLLATLVTGAEVIDLLDATKNDKDLPDLIILDHNMPLMNGKQTLTFLKSSKRYSRIKVCICSTYADHQLTEDCMNLGAFKVASKPITEEEYQLMMNDFLIAFPD